MISQWNLVTFTEHNHDGVRRNYCLAPGVANLCNNLDFASHTSVWSILIELLSSGHWKLARLITVVTDELWCCVFVKRLWMYSRGQWMVNYYWGLWVNIIDWHLIINKIAISVSCTSRCHQMKLAWLSWNFPSKFDHLITCAACFSSSSRHIKNDIAVTDIA